MNISELIDKYISHKHPGNHLESIKEKLIDYQKYLMRNYGEFYKALDLEGVSSDQIYKDTCQYLISLISAKAKATSNKAISDFWTTLYKNNVIKCNPITMLINKEIPITEMDRHLKLVKFLQGKERTIEDIGIELLFSERTIRGDIRKLREGSALWNFIKIEEFGTNNKIAFRSSIHPFVLALNLTSLVEVFVALNELKNPKYEYHNAFDLLLSQLSPQLTDYAKERIVHAGVQISEVKEPIQFVGERDYLNNNIVSQLIYGMKSRRPINIVVDHQGVISKLKVYVVPGRRSSPETKFVFKMFERGEEFSLPLKVISEVIIDES